MVHFCVFGGREGQLGVGRNVYITLFGGSEFKRPAMARRLIDRPRDSDDDAPFYFFFTAFGSTSIKWPTLVEEYLALMESLRAGSLTLERWDRSVARSSDWGTMHTASFTIFGGLETDELPSEEDELDDLSLQRHAGQIPPQAVEFLMLAVGQAGAQRLAAVRQAVAATVSNT
jgi:hypothetical protein